LNAKETLERLRKGEDMPVSKPLTMEDFKRITGFSEIEMRHCEVVNAICKLGAYEELLRAQVDKPMGPRERRIARRVLRNALKQKGAP
jgi:hypothetical protein